MLTLITGTPGSSKTLQLIDELHGITDRPIYYHGIPQLTDSLRWHKLTDAKNWHKEVPDNAIIIIDEVQQIYPTRPPKNPAPEGVQSLETHRHHGWDLYFITQHPTLLDHHARRLVGRHKHIQRNFGMSVATVYDNNKVMDISDRRDLRSANKTQYKFNKKIYGYYKSAEVHTHKVRLPKKLILIPLLIILPIIAATYGWSVIFDDKTNKKEQSGIKSLNELQQDYEDRSKHGTDLPTVSPETRRVLYINQHTPIIEGLPQTAPIYKEVMKVKSFPRPNCISNASKTVCKCWSQQASRMTVPLYACLNIIENGYFDYTLEDRKRSQAAPPRADRATKTKKNNTIDIPPPTALFAKGYSQTPDYIGHAAGGERY